MLQLPPNHSSLLPSKSIRARFAGMSAVSTLLDRIKRPFQSGFAARRSTIDAILALCLFSYLKPLNRGCLPLVQWTKRPLSNSKALRGCDVPFVISIEELHQKYLCQGPGRWSTLQPILNKVLGQTGLHPSPGPFPYNNRLDLS